MPCLIEKGKNLKYSYPVSKANGVFARATIQPNFLILIYPKQSVPSQTAVIAISKYP
jgi:hypothetical protein